MSSLEITVVQILGIQFYSETRSQSENIRITGQFPINDKATLHRSFHVIEKPLKNQCDFPAELESELLAREKQRQQLYDRALKLRLGEKVHMILDQDVIIHIF